MGRLSAIFIAFCMVLIAASAGAVTYLSFGFTGMEASVVAIATLTALVMVNSVTGRQRDRFDVGSQIADLSRGTADIGRQVSELLQVVQRLVVVSSGHRGDQDFVQLREPSPLLVAQVDRHQRRGPA